MATNRTSAASGKLAAYASFDGGVRIAAPCEHIGSQTQALNGDGAHARIPRGGGYSYVAASFGEAVRTQELRGFNRLLSFSAEQGTLDVQPGATLLDVYRLAAPHGLYLPVQPGYPLVTVGGCIGANVHGKNPARGGTFETQVLELDVYHPLHGVRTVSREQHPELFSLTCGGFGLTGLILRARLRLSRLAGSRVRLQHDPVATLQEGYERLRDAAQSRDVAYTWHRIDTPGTAFGRGFVISGTILPGPAPTAADPARVRPISSETRGHGFPPLWNRWSAALFGRVYLPWAARARERELPVFEALFPLAEKVLYFHLYGRRGFYEYQALVPHVRAAAFLEALRATVSRLRAPAVFAAMRIFAGRQQWLKFDGEGVSLSLNLPRTAAAAGAMAALNGLLAVHGAVPFVLKNATLDAATVAACFADYDAFRTALRRIDPERRYRSELSARLAL